MNPYFIKDEFEQRFDHACKLMDTLSLDALFLTSDTNVYYLAGHQPFQPWYLTTRPVLLIIPRNAFPVLVVSNGFYGAATRDTWIEDVRTYSELQGGPVGELVNVIHSLGLQNARIGAELGTEQRMGIPPADFAKIKEDLPDVQWVDSADVLWQLRLIKSPTEVECIRSACSAVMHAYSTVFPNLVAGITQEQLVHQIQAAICNAGSDPGFVIVASNPETYVRLACLPSSEPLERGYLITVDAGATSHGYWSDFSRGAFLGSPSDDILRTWETIYQITMKGLDVVRPGIPISEIFKICSAEAEKRGVTLGIKGGRIGHSIGLSIAEPPSITPNETTALSPGMILALEPSIKNASGYFVNEQNFVVTEDGFDLLSQGPWQLWLV
jgi:Xaa-Pro aminopeptidase